MSVLRRLRFCKAGVVAVELVSAIGVFGLSSVVAAPMPPQSLAGMVPTTAGFALPRWDSLRGLREPLLRMSVSAVIVELLPIRESLLADVADEVGIPSSFWMACQQVLALMLVLPRPVGLELPLRREAEDADAAGVLRVPPVVLHLLAPLEEPGIRRSASFRRWRLQFHRSIPRLVQLRFWRAPSDPRLVRSNCSFQRLASPSSIGNLSIDVVAPRLLRHSHPLRLRVPPPRNPALRHRRRRRCHLLLGFLVLFLFWMFGLLVASDSESKNVEIIKIIQRFQESKNGVFKPEKADFFQGCGVLGFWG